MYSFSIYFKANEVEAVAVLSRGEVLKFASPELRRVIKAIEESGLAAEVSGEICIRVIDRDLYGLDEGEQS